MKNRLLFLMMLLISVVSIAQNGFNYKALLKDTNGNPMVNTTLTIEFYIIDSMTATDVYSETHSTTTDANAIVNVVIGQGTTGGDFNSIDWSAGPYELSVAIDDGNEYIDLGSSPFTAVPYAKVAESVINGPEDISQFALASATLSSSQSLFPGNSYLKVNFDNELIDTGGNYENTTKRFTVTEAGTYKIYSQVYGKSQSSTSQRVGFNIAIFINGSPVVFSANTNRGDFLQYENTLVVSSIENLEIGDYIEIYAKYTEINNVDIIVGSNGKANLFYVERIR